MLATHCRLVVLKGPLLMRSLRLTNSRLPLDPVLPPVHVNVVEVCLGTAVETEGLSEPRKGREGKAIKPSMFIKTQVYKNASYPDLIIVHIY